MAGDTRDSSSNPNPNPKPIPRGPPPGETSPPPHIQSQSPKIYEVFPTNNATAPKSANALPPGSGLNTAGARDNPRLNEVWKTLNWQDFKQVHMYPCVREAGLMGLGVGFGVGGMRGLFGASLWKACNWAVGSLVFSSAASFEFCQYRRRLEKTYMKRAVEIIDTKKAQKEKEIEMKRRERREAKERMERDEEEKKEKEKEKEKKGWLW